VDGWADAASQSAAEERARLEGALREAQTQAARLLDELKHSGDEVGRLQGAFRQEQLLRKELNNQIEGPQCGDLWLSQMRCWALKEWGSRKEGG